jgi:hypothetical protein
MSLESLLTKTATIYHLAIYGLTGDSQYKKRWQSTGVSAKAAIQPASDNEIVLVDGQYGKTFRLYTLRATDIRSGDLVVVDSVDYLVQAVQDRNYGINQHKTAIITLPSDE